MSPTDSTDVSAQIDVVTEAFAQISPDGALHGPGADSLRAALVGHGDRLGSITSAVQAVATAAEQRKALVAERDAAMPTDDEFQQAEDALVTAAAAAADAEAGGDANAVALAHAGVQKATDRLADLLAQKKAAQERFDHGEKASADTLDSGVAGLPDAKSAPVDAKSAIAPLSALLSNLQKMPFAAPAAAGAPPVPQAVDAGNYAPGQQDPAAALLDSLLPGDDENSSRWPDGEPTALGAPVVAPGEGQTHTSADVSTQQMPTLRGVVTAADVSGRAANPFLAPPLGSPVAHSPGGGMMPPMMPMGGAGGPGVASGRDRGGAHIIKKDPDLTGDDIDVAIATSGIIGRNGKR
jgi:hypothetical protein